MLTARPEHGPEVGDAPTRPTTPAGLVPRQPSKDLPADPAGDLADLGWPQPAAAPSTRPDATGRRGRVAVRVAVVAAAAALACAGALARLWPDCRDQAAAAAHLAVLPAGLALLLRRSRPAPDEPDIHDRQVDYLVGLPLLAVAVFLLTAMPARLGERFWTAHTDLLLLPPLLAGAVALVFGTRAMWRLRTAFLLLAAALVPLPGAVGRALARPALALLAGPVHAVAGPVLTAAPLTPGPLTPGAGRAAGPLTGAMTGAAGVAAALIVAVLLGCGVAGWPAVRRGAGVLGLWSILAAVRIGVAAVAARAGAVGAARAVLGVDGDIAVLVVLFGVLAAVGTRTSRRGARRPEPVRRRAAVPRSRWALALVLVAGMALGLLGTVYGPVPVGPA